MPDPSLPKRSTDDPDFDPASVRGEDVVLNVSPEAMRIAIASSKFRSVLLTIVLAVATAAAASAITGWVVGGIVTRQVTRDVRTASVRNCQRANKEAQVGPVVKQFLQSDAAFNKRLGAEDAASGRIDRDLSIQVRKLGTLLPPKIATDYFAQSRVYQRLAHDRVSVSNLWAGKHGKSLAGAILQVTQAPCDEILSSP